MIGIRADANSIIASGHVMRCIAIALKLQRMGREVCFYVSDDYSASLFKKYKMRYHVLGSAWNDKRGETSLLLPLLKKHGVKLLLVDSYEVCQEYFKELHPWVRLAYIDDFCPEPYDVDIVINYVMGDCGNIYDELYKEFQYEKRPVFLTGPAYTPLREEFENVARQASSVVTDILITNGGSDSSGMTAELARALEAAAGRDVRLHIVEGPFFEAAVIREIQAIEQESRGRVIVHRNVTNMKKLMMQCQLAVSAGGTTLLEICACGLPCVCYAVNERQLPLIRFLDGQQAVLVCTADIAGTAAGPAADIAGTAAELAADIAEAAAGLAADNDVRIRLAGKAAHIVDGCGAQRLAGALDACAG